MDIFQIVFRCFLTCLFIFLLGGVAYSSICFCPCSIYLRTINLLWLFGLSGSRAYITWCTQPDSANCVCACLCMFLHRWLVFWSMSPLWLMSSFLDVCVHSGVYSCAHERARWRAGRECLLFIDCKEVLSVSVWAAEWVELVKPFSSPRSNPGDRCVDATLTAITHKFKRL